MLQSWKTIVLCCCSWTDISQHRNMERNHFYQFLSHLWNEVYPLKALLPLLTGLVVLGSEWHLLLLIPPSSLKEQRWSLSRLPSWRVQSSSYSASGKSGVNRWAWENMGRWQKKEWGRERKGFSKWYKLFVWHIKRIHLTPTYSHMLCDKILTCNFSTTRLFFM